MRYILLLTVLLASNAFAAPDFDETMAAANQGDAYAQFNLALMFNSGIGVPENYVHAYVWLSMAKTDSQASEPDFLKAHIAKQQAIAASFLDSLRSLMTKQQIAEAQSLAAQCYESGYRDCD